MTGWTHDAGSRVTCEELGNGTRASYTYDDADRIVVLANIRSSGTTISSFEYSYDGAGNRLGVVEANGDRVTWTYDNTYQLTRERRSGANAYDITYTYDGVGNRLTKEEDSAVTTYAYDAANEMTQSEDESGVTTYTYDAAGNMALSVNPSEEATTYSWDYENRLTAVELPSSAISTFTYKSDGLRVQKEDSAGTTKFIWDGQNVLLETDGDGDTVAAYTLAPANFGMLLAQRRGGATKFFHFDALGSTDRLTNAAQAVSDSYLYEAFGKVIASSGSTANPFKYVGRLGYYFDPDLGQYYLRARWYDPATGRFVCRSPSPVTREHPYSYCRCNPIVFVDPTGMDIYPFQKCPPTRCDADKDPDLCHDWLNPHPAHWGQRCYRSEGLPMGPMPSRHCCYDKNGTLVNDHIDYWGPTIEVTVSPRPGRDCIYNPIGVVGHTIIDVPPWWPWNWWPHNV